MFIDRTDLDTHDRLMSQAKADAKRLRREAVEHFGEAPLTDLWRGANAVWLRMSSVQTLVQRSATRLQARLHRQQRARGTNPAKAQTHT